MNVTFWQALLSDESAQDLLEYALVAALVGFGAIAAMHGVASGISSGFSRVSSDLSSSVGHRH